jgi:DNA repair protein RecN (Recombination protein N)
VPGHDDDPLDLLRRRLAADAATPLLTFYDTPTGERVELSAATFATWVAKVSHLLRDDVGLVPGDRVGLLARPHWLPLGVCAGVWAAGCTLVLDLAPGEDAELAERAERLTNLEDLRSAAAEAHEALSAESDALDAISLADTARRALERGGRHDPALTALAERAAEAGYLLRDLAGDVSSYLAGLDADGAHDLELVHERRAALAALARKYGPTLEDVLALLSSGGDRLLEIDGDSDRIALLEQQVAADAAAARERAADLTRRRTEAAGLLAEAVTAELAALAMPEARVVVMVEPRAELAGHGAAVVQILLRPHPGSEPRPLGRGASGGELSLVMLALEVVLAASDPVPTFVFDEIDAGVGGAAAIEIGRRLARLAESAQVIVVTHLAQVAAFATNHLAVVKGSDGAVTASSVTRLDGEARVAEMARLLSGLPDSATGLEHARELLDLAHS